MFRSHEGVNKNDINYLQCYPALPLSPSLSFPAHPLKSFQRSLCESLSYRCLSLWVQLPSIIWVPNTMFSFSLSINRFVFSECWIYMLYFLDEIAIYEKTRKIKIHGSIYLSQGSHLSFTTYIPTIDNGLRASASQWPRSVYKLISVKYNKAYQKEKITVNKYDGYT